MSHPTAEESHRELSVFNVNRKQTGLIHRRPAPQRSCSDSDVLQQSVEPHKVAILKVNYKSCNK